MKVKSEPSPNTILIQESLDKKDFIDTFSTTNHKNNLEEITRLLFEKSPKWVEYLMRFRNFLVKFIGLKTTKPKDIKTTYKVGSYISFFKIFTITENEIILGADDSHLKFRVSVYNNQAKEFNIKVTTVVEYLNRKGKIYFFIVKPFHRFIVRRMVKQAYVE